MGGPGPAVNPPEARFRPKWTQRGKLPEEGLEPTRTYAQALLRRPRLPFRHSGSCGCEYIRAIWMELMRNVSV